MPAVKSMSVKFNEEQLKAVNKLINNIGKKGAKPLAWAINKTMTGSATARGTGGLIKDSVDEMAKYINMLKGTLKHGPHSPGHKVSKKNQIWHVKKATVDDLDGKLECTSKNVPLIHFSNKRNMKSRAKSISVQVFKDRKRRKLKHAFIPKLPSGHVGIFQRVKGGGKSRSGRSRIKELYTGRVSDFYSNTPMLDDIIMQKAQDRLDKNLAHELDYFMNKMNEETGGKK